MPNERTRKDSVRLRIGELAAEAGVTPQAIRYYESLGLLGPKEREGKGYRYYGEEELHRLKKLQTLQSLGLSLDDIANVLPLYYSDPTGVAGKRKIIELLQRQLEETDKKLAAIHTFRDELLRNIAKFELYLKEASRR